MKTSFRTGRKTTSDQVDEIKFYETRFSNFYFYVPLSFLNLLYLVGLITLTMACLWLTFSWFVKTIIKMITFVVSGHLNTLLSISGCFKKVFINGRMFDFTSITTQFKVLPGCSVTTDPCETHQCKSGRCHALDANRYKCECSIGFSGTLCDIGIIIYKLYMSQMATRIFLCVCS